MESRGTIRAIGAMGVAVVFGGIAVVSLFQLMTTYQTQIDEARRPEDTVLVIVASRDLYPGVRITEDDLIAVRLQPRFLPRGVFLAPEYVVGQHPRERILANEFVRGSRLANPESGEGLNAVIPRQMRAISIEIADGAALSGFVEPGNYVDMLVTLEPDDDRRAAPPETHTVLQAVFVLGVNSRAQAEQAETRVHHASKPSVTFLVTPEQAERVAHAERVGKIRLALRNDLDDGEVTTSGVARIRPPPVAPVPSPSPRAPVAAPPAEQPEPLPEPGREIIFIRGTEAPEHLPVP